MEIVSREIIRSAPVVTVERVKANLRLQDNSFDEMIADYISSAIKSSENITGVTIPMSQYVITGVYEGSYRVPVAPITNITATCNEEEIDVAIDGGVITLPLSCVGKQVVLTIKAGYVEVPADIKMAIILKASAMFLNPVDSADTYVKSSDNLLKAYRVWR